MDADTGKVLIGSLGLTYGVASVRLIPDEKAPVVYQTKPSLLLAVNAHKDPYWLRVLGKDGGEGFVRAMDVQDLGYPLRRKLRVTLVDGKKDSVWL